MISVTTVCLMSLTELCEIALHFAIELVSTDLKTLKMDFLPKTDLF